MTTVPMSVLSVFTVPSSVSMMLKRSMKAVTMTIGK